MKGAADAFFEGLASRGHEPLLARTKGTLKVELTNGGKVERWLVTVDNGAVSVSHRNVRADCTIRTTKALFDGIAAGGVRPMPAFLRGAVDLDGDWELLVRFQRLLAGTSAGSGG